MPAPRLDISQGLCHVNWTGREFLWDSELDGSEKNRKGETPEHRRRRHAVASLVCQCCPIRVACGEYARHTDGASGIFGGQLV